MSIIKEPEAIEDFIAPDETIDVETDAEEDNILIDIGKNEDGSIYVQIWDSAKTEYVIYKDGKNLFEAYL
ncbi:hypothetical protein B0I18_11565 [Taibaiella chishuiensis]|uniref:Uncharacterized protein n=2 Tax=Taibaiella chishuiensis TaxID=1434707 RepID=A0A2P8CT75_9BACT|nr:hypothetical protein B0I18_11565 [Taibaiella chishuiensis]